MFDFLAGLLAFFYDAWPSYAGAIMLFTLTIMLALTPLSLKSTRSMIRMQRVQPELKKLQNQYKGDREALNREMMAFYQANNINPFASCLPLLLQMPVFFILYQVLSGLTRRDSAGLFAPKYLDHDSALYQALHETREMLSIGMDLSRSAWSVLRDDGLVDAAPFILLVLVVAASTWYQQKQISGRNPNAEVNPQQQMITKVLPFMFIPISVSVPAGLVIYFVTQNAVRIGQNVLVTKLEYGSGADPIAPPAAAPPAPKPTTSLRDSGRVTKSGETPRPAPNRNKKKKRK